MRTISKILFLSMLVSLLVASCDRKDYLPTYTVAGTPLLTASAVAVAPVAADSSKTALTLNWSEAGHATDSLHVKYIVEIDSTGKNFANKVTKEVMTRKTTSFTAKELNDILLGKGYAFNAPADMDVRVISSYANGNDKVVSNVLKIRMTAYKIPPKVAVPTSGKLFIVGGATPGGWNNPVVTPAQELTRIDETTFGAILDFAAGQSYLLLPVNGSWDVKYGFAGSNNGNNAAGDNFSLNGGDMLAPATSGSYKLIVDFQSGKFSLTPFTQQHGLPTELYVVGDATSGGWNNPVPVPSQKFTRVSNSEFQIASLAMTAGKNYLLLPTNGDWGRKFGAVDKSAANIKLGGAFKPEGEDMPSPDVSGNYKVTVNFLTNRYTLVKL